MENPIDNFGNEIGLINGMSIDAMNAFFRFHLDGMIEGIAESLSIGIAGDAELKFFGLI